MNYDYKYAVMFNIYYYDEYHFQDLEVNYPEGFNKINPLEEGWLVWVELLKFDEDIHLAYPTEESFDLHIVDWLHYVTTLSEKQFYPCYNDFKYKTERFDEYLEYFELKYVRIFINSNVDLDFDGFYLLK